MALPGRAWFDQQDQQDIQYVAALLWSWRDGVSGGGPDRRPGRRNKGLATSHLHGRRSGWRSPSSALEQTASREAAVLLFRESFCPRADWRARCCGEGRVSLLFTGLRSLAAAWHGGLAEAALSVERKGDATSGVGVCGRRQRRARSRKHMAAVAVLYVR